MIPHWLHQLSIIFIVLGMICAGLIAADEFRHPQRMWIMNLVWPLVALFGTLITVTMYLRYGRLDAKRAPKRKKPFAVMVASGTNHCGSGCALGDICAEWIAFGFPAVAVWFGWRSLFGEKMFAVWILDYLFAFVFGIAFQYFTIAPMRGLGLRDGLIAAVKADTLSLTAWQVGMYGFMAFASFYLFQNLLGVKLEVDTPEFWLMMQLAMLCGFATSYPVNWWLIRAGIKEKM